MNVQTPRLPSPKRMAVLLLFGCMCVTQAQKKKELIEEIVHLKDSIFGLQDSINSINRKMKASDSKATLFEKENAELRDANATLLKNLSSFSQISKQNTETVNKALATLKEKEAQLKFITDNFSSNDSTAIVILTQAKNTLGPEAKVGISDGDVLFSNTLDQLFGNDTITKLSEEGQALITKIGALIKTHPSRKVSVEGLNITGEFKMTYQQASSVANALGAMEGIKADLINVLVKDGNFKEGIIIRMAPDARGFYNQLKTEFK